MKTTKHRIVYEMHFELEEGARPGLDINFLNRAFEDYILDRLPRNKRWVTKSRTATFEGEEA